MKSVLHGLNKLSIIIVKPNQKETDEMRWQKIKIK